MINVTALTDDIQCIQAYVGAMLLFVRIGRRADFYVNLSIKRR